VRDEPDIFAMSTTPFDAKERIDEPALRRHLRFLADGGVGICLGSFGSGEGHLLRANEIARLYEVAVDEVGGRATLCATALGFTSTEQVIEDALAAASTGVDVVQIHPPRPGPTAIRPRASEIERFFRDVLEAVRTPVHVTNQVVMVGYALEPSLVDDLVASFPQIRGVTTTDRDVAATRAMVRRLAPRVAVRVGVIEQLLDALACGGRGALCFEANVAPRLCAGVARAHARGERKQAERDFETLLALNAVLARYQNPRSVKAAMDALGLPGGPPRRPYLPLPDDEVHDIARVLRELGIAAREGIEN